MTSSLVSYAYYEGTDSRNMENLTFFLRHGVERFRTHPYPVSVWLSISDGVCSVPLPQESDRFHILRRPNAGYDFGAHRDVLTRVMEYHSVKRIDALPYQTYMLLNCSQRGPFLPRYWPVDRHWIHAWTQGLQERRLDLLSASVFAHGICESWAVAVSARALHHVWAPVFQQAPLETKSDVCECEKSLTRTVRSAGWRVGSMLMRDTYGFQRPQNPDDFVPSRPWAYDGISIHPLETMFYKTYWSSSSVPEENFYECPFEARYSQWLNQEDIPRSIISLRPTHWPAGLTSGPRTHGGILAPHRHKGTRNDARWGPGDRWPVWLSWVMTVSAVVLASSLAILLGIRSFG